mgnify:CR=1 FL=1
MAFGQYFDHGLDFLPKGGAGQVVIDGVDIPGPVASNFTDLTRGSLAEPLASADDIPQHINKTSAYVDQNQVYGSNMIVGQLLRESDGNHGYGSRILMGADDPSASGFELMSTLRELLDHHREAGTLFTGPGLPTGGITIDGYYPTLWNSATNNYDAATVRALAGNFMGSSHALLLDTNPVINLLDHYVGGDGRTNENVTLTSMHTIWARNHNFHIDTLLDAGFAGTTEELFQAAKMVNEAEYQRVVFTEFADALIGGIQGVGDHGFEAYNAEATAGISHEFAAAVYRIGHSLIGDTITVKGDDGQNYSVNLFDAFLNPSNDVFTPEQLIQLQAMGYDPQPGYEQLGTGAILAGIVEQPAEEVDFNIVDAVRNDLVRIRADLFAFNVARGRDVGLGTLNQVKASLQNSTDPYVKFAVGFLSANGGSVNPYSSWQDFQTRNGLTDIVIAQFMAAYPDLVLRADQINAFKAINGDIVAVQAPASSRASTGSISGSAALPKRISTAAWPARLSGQSCMNNSTVCRRPIASTTRSASTTSISTKTSSTDRNSPTSSNATPVSPVFRRIYSRPISKTARTMRTTMTIRITMMRMTAPSTTTTTTTMRTTAAASMTMRTTPTKNPTTRRMMIRTTTMTAMMMGTWSRRPPRSQPRH